MVTGPLFFEILRIYNLKSMIYAETVLKFEGFSGPYFEK